MSYAQIAYPRLRELLGGDAQLVEVLPSKEYRELHLPAALNIPLLRMADEGVEVLDRARAVVVYCWDGL